MKTGLFFSTCNDTINHTLNLEALAEHYPDLASVKVFRDFYDPEDFTSILREVEDKGLDSVVLAGESPIVFRQTRNGEYLFLRLAQLGVNLNRVDVVNLRNMVARAHTGNAKDLLAKARVLINVGLARVRSGHDLTLLEIAPRKSVAIVGGGGGGLAAAMLLLEAGFKVSMIHDAESISLSPKHRAMLQPTLTAVLNHPRFTLFLKASVTDCHGFAGDFLVTFGQSDDLQSRPFGAVILSPDEKKRISSDLQSQFHLTFDETTSFRSKDANTLRNRTRSLGIYVINPTNRSNEVSDLLQAADATAADVINLLNNKELHHRVTVSEVEEELCGGCGACVKTCMFHAVTMQGNPSHSVIDARRCQGCGNCVTACPADARDLIVCPSNYLYEAVEILSRFRPPEGKKTMLALACDGCGYECFDNAPEMGITWPMGIMPLWTVCGGQIDTQLIMHAFNQGFDGVALLICAEGCCHNIVGNVDLERRLHLFKQILSSRNIADNRLRVISTCSTMNKETIESIKQFYLELHTSGPKAVSTGSPNPIAQTIAFDQAAPPIRMG